MLSHLNLMNFINFYEWRLKTPLLEVYSFLEIFLSFFMLYFFLENHTFFFPLSCQIPSFVAFYIFEKKVKLPLVFHFLRKSKNILAFYWIFLFLKYCRRHDIVIFLLFCSGLKWSLTKLSGTLPSVVRRY